MHRTKSATRTSRLTNVTTLDQTPNAFFATSLAARKATERLAGRLRRFPSIDDLYGDESDEDESADDLFRPT